MPKTYLYYKYIWTHYLQFILLNFSLILLLRVKMTKNGMDYEINKEILYSFSRTELILH
ncbi:hypothetical protein HMPREF1548_02687 [Clostridium sp. KLE 1755]|nr:hypothetical protein HMPREF1548_02687 [Clostridium sp. KLE 1755]